MCVRFRGVWPVAPRGLLGLSAALVARCVWLGLVALSIVRCDRLGLAALMNVLRNRLDLPTQRLRREVDWAWPRCLTRIVRLVGFWSSDLRNSRFLPKRGKKGGLAERRASFFHVPILSARFLVSCRGNRVFALLWTSASHLVAGAVLRGGLRQSLLFLTCSWRIPCSACQPQVRALNRSQLPFSE